MGREDRRPLRVLAADDSAVMRGVLKTLFELHARDGDPSLPPMELCGLVQDGIRALEAVETLSPDVLLDLDMTRMNGLEVLQRLRIQAPKLPVIMCSAHTERCCDYCCSAIRAGIGADDAGFRGPGCAADGFDRRSARGDAWHALIQTIPICRRLCWPSRQT